MSFLSLPLSYPTFIKWGGLGPFVLMQLGGVAGVYEKGHLGVRFLRESMCAKGMGCERRCVRWVLRGTGTASGHPGVP